MTFIDEVEDVLSASRTARRAVAAELGRTRQRRLAMEFQRVRARSQLTQLERKLDELRVTLALVVPTPLAWLPPNDALDDVLFPVD